MCSTFHFHSSSGGIFELFFLSPFSKKGHKRINDILTTRKVHSEQSLTKQTFSLSFRNGNFLARKHSSHVCRRLFNISKPFAAAGSHMVPIFSDFHCKRFFSHGQNCVSGSGPPTPTHLVSKSLLTLSQEGFIVVGGLFGGNLHASPLFDRLLRKCW